MKRYSSILFLFLTSLFSVSTTFASVTLTSNVIPAQTVLCDASCDLTITFPDGGTLTATQGLTFTFGNGGGITLGEAGTMNVAVQFSSLDFPDGGALSLVAGESISFGVGGFVKTESGGNFTFSEIEVTEDVGFDVVLDDGGTSVTLATINVNGDLTVTTDGDILYTGSNCTVTASTSTGATLNSSGSTVTISSDPQTAAVCIDSVSSVITTTNTGTISIDPAVDLTNSGSISIDSTVVLTTSEPVTLSSLTLVPVVGETLPTGDANNECTVVEGGRCITESGIVYEFVDGELVVVKGGALDWFTLMLLIVYLTFVSGEKSRLSNR